MALDGAVVRYAALDGTVGVGVMRADGIRAFEEVGSLARLWHMPVHELRALVDGIGPGQPLVANGARLLAPVDGRTEVWAAGVTYHISRDARMEESDASADVYQHVYQAARPELFFKSAAWRVRGDGEVIAIRDDSDVDVPEPELALVVNRHGEIAGYTICNDVSSRSIEGENPLYLPQAKVYLGGCAIGPWIVPAWMIRDPYALRIAMTVSRGGHVYWSGETNSSELHRKLEDLVEYLTRADIFPDGVVLATGTSLVPPLAQPLVGGDVVTITIDDVGVLTNRVVVGRDAVLAEGGQRWMM